jgi:lysophospholipase L1-like esterase
VVTRGITLEPRPWRRFVALGDSFTEGLMDDVTASGAHIGWADRVAAVLAGRTPGFEYANLAIRGRKAPQVFAEQVHAAVALRPDLASVAVGVNDTLRRSFDLNASATAIEQSVRLLRDAGSDVLLWCFGDPSRTSKVMGVVAGRIEALRRTTYAIAVEYGCYLVDFWGAAVLDDARLWHGDRLHLNPAGHIIAARAALEALGLGDDAWRTPMASAVPTPWPRRTAADVTWAAVHLRPWVVRRIRGVTSGDGVTAKQPQWGPAPQLSPPLG